MENPYAVRVFLFSFYGSFSDPLILVKVSDTPSMGEFLSSIDFFKFCGMLCMKMISLPYQNTEESPFVGDRDERLTVHHLLFCLKEISPIAAIGDRGYFI